MEAERAGMDKITSTSNAKVKRLVNLKKKRKARDEEKVFLVEGIRMFREMPSEILKEVYVSETFYKKERDMTGQFLTENGRKKAAVEILSDTVFGYVSDTKTPQGILCVARQKEYGVEDVAKGEIPHIIVLDHLQDPGNLGTIFRTAEGAGVTGIIMNQESVDIYNPKTIRSTMGSIYRMPFCYTADLADAVRFLKAKGVRTYAAHLEGICDYDKEDYQKPCAFLIGNEGNGLTQEIAELADTYIKIPMKGEVESLNAAIAASVLMFEAARQRRG
jgi:TrmH family RNA methyltransferase